MAKRFSVDAVFRAIDKVTAPVSRMQNRIGKMTRSAGRNIDKLNRKMDKFGSRAKRGAMAVGVAAAVTGAAMTDVIRTGADFEHDLVVAAAKFPGIIRQGTEEYAKLEAAARQAGRTTEFTASQSARALREEAQAGFSLTSAIGLLPGLTDLATAADLELAEATSIAAKSLGAFGLRTKDATQLVVNFTRVSDVLTAVANSSGTNVQEFFEVIAQGGTVFEQAGASIETFGAIVGTMANSGKVAGEAGTQARNALLALTAATPQAKAALKFLKVELDDGTGNMRDYFDIIEDINTALSPFGNLFRQAALKMIFQKRAITGINILLKEGADGLRGYRTELEGAGGMTKTLADIIRQDFKNVFKTLLSAIESVKISIFTFARGPLSEAVQKITEWVRANEELISTRVGEFLLTLVNNFDKIVETVKRVGSVAKVIVPLIVAFKALSAILILINIITATNPLVFIVMAAIALIAVIVVLLSRIKAIRDAFNWVVNGVKSLWKGMIDGIQKMWDGLVGGIEKSLNWIKGAVEDVKGFPGAVARTFGFGGDDEGDAPRQGDGPQVQVVTSGDRVARSIEESNTTNRGEILIRDETGRAYPEGTLPPGIQLQPTGAF